MHSPIWLIARREIVTRWQQKGYRIGVGVTLLIAVIAVVLPSYFSGGNKPTSYDISLAPSQDTARVAAGLRIAAAAVGVTVHIDQASPARARAKVSAGTADAAILPNNVVVVQHSSDDAASIARAGLVLAAVAPATGTKPPAVRIEALKSGNDTQRTSLAIITVVVLFSQLIMFCTWVATGVVEEKSSRVVELLLSAVRPVQLLAGKLLGIGAVATAQVAALGGTALIAATAAGTLTLPASDLLTVLVSFVAFLLGFALFAAVSAALGSTVSRQEEVSGVLAPVSVVLMACYLVSFFVASNDTSTAARVLSIVPPVSSIAMPARIARDSAGAGDVVFAVALLIISAGGALLLAARIYRASVLHTGSRLRLRQAWRGEEVAATPR